jgi:hypothetical protein
LSDLINTEARKEAVKKAREGKKVADKKAKNKTIEEALGINLGAETGASAATPSTYQQLVDDVAAQTDSPSTSVDSPSSPETQTRLQAVPSASANQAAYDFDVSGITEANAREMQRIKTEAQTNGTFMKAPNGKPTNLNERQWLQVRTPHFKEWFGNWELKYQKVTPVTATKNRFKNFADARSWAEENIVGILSNEQTGGKGDIEITKDAIKKFFSSSATEKSDNTTAHKDVIAVLPEVIKNSIVGEIHLDYIKESNVRRPENGIVPGTSIHRLFGAVNIDGVTYRVKTTVRYFDDVNTENKAHSYEVTKIELLAGNMANTDNSTDPNTNNSISLSPNRTANTVSPIEAAKLLNGVEKSYEKGRFILDDHSKVVDANGEPMAMHHGTKKNFTVFDREKNLLGNGGFYFTSSEREYPYKNVMPVFLNIKNPADSFNKISWHKGFEENTEKYDGSFESRSYGNNTKWATVANPSQIKSATANNGNFDTRSDDIRYQFIGEKGAANLDKAQEATTRMDNLRVAKEMERSYSPEEIDKARQMAFEAIPEELKNDARKVNRDEDTDGSAMKRIQENPKAKEAWSDYIRALERRKTAKLGKEERQRIKLATGWERGADGKWRYEVLDFKSINKEVYNLLHGGETYNTVKLPALIGENDDLFKSYPQLKELNIARNDIDSSGVFSPGGNVQITINENLTSLSAKSTLIHEIQHAIQDIEGFAQGTSPNIDHRDRQIKDLNEAYALVDDKVRRYIELKGKERYGGIDKMPIDEVVELSKLEKDEAVKKVDNSLREVFKKYGSNMDVVSFENGQAESFYKDASTRRYFKSAGEVEARNASHRRNMTPEERRASLASETEDVAREDQIFLYDTLGEQAMAEEANLEIVNTRFNEELDTLTPENARSKTLWLGNPSVTLQSAGIKNKALKLYGAKLLSKAKKHSFNFNDLKNLPNAVQSPIAVFKGSVEGSHAILTELNINGNNVLVTLNIGKGEDVDFNIISSTYGKSSEGIVGWVNNGKMLYVDKEKTLNYLRISAPIAEAQDNTRLPESNPDDLGSLALNNASAINSQELNSATKIVQNFQNPKLSGENSHISDKKFTPISRKQAEALAGLLKKSGLAKDVVFGQEELAKVVGAGFKPVQSPQNIRLLSTPAGEIYGAVKDGVVYLDDTKLNANTPIHEFGHLWNDLVKKDNPQLWAKIVELAKETPYFKELLNNPAYANLDNDDARADEAFAQAMGDEGERIFNDPNAPKSIKERFKQLLKDFWEWLGRKLGIRNLSPGQISKLNFGQAVKGAVADITSGKPITFKDVVEKVTQPKNNITEKPLSLRDVINEKGEINYDQLRSISRTIEQGNYSTQYFTEEVERSRAAGGRRNVEASLILGGSQSANAEKQQALLEQYFEHEGLLYDLADYMDKNQDRFLNDALNNAEAVVFRSNDGKSVEKFINYRINSDTPFDFINNRVVLHNHLFIETKYELIGAAKFNGQFFFMVKQPFIKGIATENREEFYRHMKERGYEENDLQLNAFHDKFFKISDLHEENVLKGDDGNFYFIDTVPEYKDGNLEFSIEPNKPAAPSRFSEVFDGVTEENTTFAPSEQNLTIAQMLEGTTPVETPKHSFKSLNEARQWAKENIVGTYKNDNIGENLNISKTAIDKYLSMKAVKKSVNMDAHLSALKQLPKLIETSVLKETHPDKGDDINIKEIQRLYGAIDYERQTYPVKITVKVIKSGENNAYSYEVMEIENPDEQLSHPGSSSVGDIGDLVPKSDDFLPQSTEFSISKGTNNSETAKTDLQNSQKNNTFAKNSSDESKTKLGNKRTMGSSTLRGLVGIEPQGRRIEQALAESNRRGSGGTAESSLQTGWDKDRFLASLEVSTRANGTWIDDIKSIADSRLIGGFENEPYISKDGKTVIKVNNFAFLNDNDTQYEHTRDFNYFVDRLNAHNELFPKDKYKIIGFAENSKGEVSVVLQQPFVRDAELASTAQIEAWLHENGFKRTVKPDGFVYYTNGKYELSDIKPQNVLVDTNGDLRFIDLDIVPVKEQGARFQISPKAKRQYTAGELQMTPDQLASPEPPTTPAKKIQKRGTGLVEAIVDKHQRLKNTIREIEKRTGTKVAAKDNPYDRLTKLSARAQAALEDFKNKTSEPLLNRIRSMTKHIPDVWPSADIQKHAAIAKTSPFVQLFLADTDIRRTFDFYMMAKHAPHRNAYIEKKTNGGVQNGSGITNDEAAAVIDIFEKQFTAKEIDDFWEDVEKATDTSLNAWLDTGRITKETYDELKKEMPYFVPLRNWDDSETDKSIDAIYSGGGNDTYSAYKQAEGRSTIADSPLAYIANLAQSAIVFKEKNDVKRMLFDLAAKARQSDLMQTKKIYTIETLDAAGNVVATRETTTDPRKDTVHPLAPNERVVTKSMGTKNAISPYLASQHEVEAWINGKKYMLEFADEQVAREINEEANAVAQALQKTIGRVTKGMASLMTQKNPVFWTKNTIRDVQHAAIRLGVMYDGKMALTFMKSLPRATQVAFMMQFADKATGAHSSDPVLQKFINYGEEYRKSGARVGFMQMLDIDRIKKDIDKSLKHVGDINNRNFLKKGLRAINGMAAVSEDISRLAAFIAARETGRDVSEASNIAKEVTVNFNRSGKYSGIPGSLYAFFNATVQAGANWTEMFRKHPVKAGIAAAIHAALGYFMYMLSSWLLTSDDGDGDELRNLSSYRKYISLFLPAGDNGFAQFPLSQTWRPLYAVGVAAAQIQKGELTPQEAAAGVWEQIANISPIELSGNWEQLLPTAVTPIVETFITKRNYMGAPLVAYEYNDPDGKTVPFHKRGVRTDQLPLWQNMVDILVWGDESTGRKNYNNQETGIPEELHGLDISPDQLRHLVISYTGGLGSAVNDVANLTYSLITGSGASPNKIPIVSSYYSEAKPGYYTDKYYRLRTVFDKFEKNLNYDKDTGRMVEYAGAPEFSEMQTTIGEMEAGQIEIDAVRGKSLKKVYEIWDAQEKKMQKFSAADMAGTKDKDAIRKEVERISKETVNAVEPIFRELGIKY